MAAGDRGVIFPLLIHDESGRVSEPRWLLLEDKQAVKSPCRSIPSSHLRSSSLAVTNRFFCNYFGKWTLFTTMPSRMFYTRSVLTLFGLKCHRRFCHPPNSHLRDTELISIYLWTVQFFTPTPP